MSKRKQIGLWMFLIITALFFSQNLKASNRADRVVFLATGDQGTGGYRQKQVAISMERIASKDKDTAFVLLLGDNFYPNGVYSLKDPQWQDKFEKIYRGETLDKLPFLALLGNHDYRWSEKVQIAYSQQKMGSGRWMMPDRIYSKDFGQTKKGHPLLRLVILDTNRFSHTPTLEKQSLFLKKQFTQSKDKPLWRLAAAHHPFRNFHPKRGSSRIKEHFLPLLKREKIALYLSGHDHNFQLIHSEGEPIQLISGGGGADLYDLRDTEDKSLKFALKAYGFSKIILTPERLTIELFDHHAKKRYTFSRARER
ncbi:metallophosphoesterase [Magnetococcales bacterium HHB-1]